jgi:hypothetical protein
MKFDIKGARAAGYSDDEIAAHLGQQSRFDVDGARKAGYSTNEILDHLSGSTIPAARRDLPAGVKPSTAGGGRGNVNPTAPQETTPSLATPEPSRADRIAAMNSVTDPSNPDYLPVTDNAVRALQTDARGGMDAQRSRYPGRVLDSDIEPATVTGALRDTASGALQIPGVAVKTAADVARLASGDRIGKGLGDSAEAINKAIRENVGTWRAQQQATRFQQDMVDPNLNAADLIVANPGALADMALPQVGSMALPIGAAAAAGKVATTGRAAQLAKAIDEATVVDRANKARSAAVLGTTMAQNAGDTFSEIRDSGGSVPDAYTGAAVTLPFTYAANRLTGGGLEGGVVRAMSGAKGAVKQIPGAMLKEGGQETGEEAGSYLGETIGKGEKFDSNTATKRMAVAGTLGAALGGGFESVNAARTAREQRIQTLRDAGETAAADLLQAKHDKLTTAENVESEISSMPGSPEFSDQYRGLRLNGLKPAEAAAQSAVTVTFRGLAQTLGLSDKATNAALDKAKDLPLDKVPDFLQKFTARLSPVQVGIEAVGPTLEAARDDAIDAAMGAIYDPVKQRMDEALSLESETNQPQTNTQPAQTAINTIAQSTGKTSDASTEGADGIDAPAPGMVRVYHGGQPGAANGDVWFTRSLKDAKGWASRGEGMVVEYVDIPASTFTPDAEFGTLPPERLTLPDSIASQRRPLRPVTPTDKTSNSEQSTAQPVAESQAPEKSAASPRESGDGGVAPTQDAGAPIYFGRDNIPLSEGGKAFKTKQAASDAKRNNPGLRVVRAEGGFALTEKTPAQLASEAANARRLSAPRTSPKGEPISAHAMIAAAGGLMSSEKSDMNIEGNIRVGNRTLFAGTGRGLNMEQATELLIQDGYLLPGQDMNDARNLIVKSLSTPQYTPDGWERIAQAEIEQRQQDRQDEQPVYEDAVAEFEGLSDSQIEEIDDSDIPWDTPSNTDTEATMRALGFDEKDIQDAITEGSRITSPDSQGGGQTDEGSTRQETTDSGQRESAPGEDTRSRSDPRREEAQVEPPQATQEAPSTEGVSASVDDTQAKFTTERRADGTLAVKGDKDAIREALKDIPAASLQPMTGGILVGRSQADRALSLLEPAEITAPTRQDVVNQQDAAERAAKAKEKADREADKKAREDEDRKRIAQASQAAADTFELGGDAMANLTGQKDVFSTPSEPTAAKAKESDKIKDFGEKIGGAKKDTWTGFKDDLNAVKDDDIAARKLSEIWPAPDYQKLIDDGMEVKSVALIRSIRDEVPSKPRNAYKLKRWAEQVKEGRALALNILNKSEKGEALYSELNKAGGKLSGIAGRADLYMAVGHAKSLEGIRFSRYHFSFYRGRENVSLWVVEREAAATAFSNWPQELAIGDTKEDAIEAFKARYAELDSITASKKSSFDIYSQDGKFFVGKKIGRNIAEMAGPFKTLKEAREHRTNNLEALEAKLAKYKEIPKDRRDTNEPRVGEDMRNGQDVTPEMFAESFGFKGVEFGNWVEQKRRQKDLNDAFDALMDMAAIMGVPAKAISLNGELSLAFGARGSGGVNPAAAHYESDKIVINLTKREGAGSLGHEWWHALDNYFSRMRGNKTSPFMTTATDVNLSSRRSDYQPYPGVRKEMIDAFGEVVRAIKSTAIKARSSKIDAKRTKEYWTTGEEMAARAFESYLISKLQDQNASNDYLANVVDQKTWDAMAALGMENEDSYPYPTAGEMPVIRAGFDKFFQTLETKETDTGNVAMFARGGSSDQTNTPEFKRWFGDSRVVDAQGEPLVVYHGTTQSFDTFGNGTGYFTAMPDEANMYGGINTDGANVVPAYLSIKNPKVIESEKMTGTPRDVIADALSDAKIDGVIVTEGGNVRWAVVTEPNQIKSAIGNNGQFDPNNPDIRFARGQSTEPFYSALSKGIEGLNYKQLPAFGWADAIKSLVNKGLVKQDEIEWSGITDWLAMQTGKVTKEQVLEYLDANGVQVEEVTLSDNDFELDTNGEKQLDIFGEPLLNGNPTKYSQYQLPGGESYREVLLTLPAKQFDPAELKKAREELQKHEAAYNPRTDYSDPDGPQTPWAIKEKELRSKVAQLEKGTAAQAKASGASGRRDEYKSSHWDQPNVLAHIRLNDRVDSTGARVLFVEELQSDYGQDAKKKGINGKPMFIKGMDGQEDGFLGLIAGGVPNAPFIDKTDKWLTLALKRIVKLAVDEGYDKVAFVNGDQSAERYDLSKQIEVIEYKRNPNGGGQIIADKENGDTAIRQSIASDNDLENYIGKDLAKKLLEQKPMGNMNSEAKSYVLSGLDLKVGGEGMKAFYDQIVPTATKALLKKLGGQMETVKMNQTEGFEGNARKAAAKPIVSEQPGFTITPAMREKAAGGLPMFAKNPIGTSKGLPLSEVQAIVNQVSKKWGSGPALKVVATPADLPIPAPDDARGLIRKGTAYVVAGNMQNRSDVHKTLAHEAIGHYGLWKLLGAEKTRRFERSLQLALKSGNKPLNEISKKVRSLYVDENGDFNLTPAQEANEIAAFAVENALDADGNFKPGYGFFKQLWADIAQFLRDIGIDISFTNVELQGLLISSMKGLEAGQRLGGGNELVVAAGRGAEIGSEADDLFVHPKSASTTVEGIARDNKVGGEIKAVNMPGRIQYNISLPNNSIARIVVRQVNPYGESLYGYDLDENGKMQGEVIGRPGENAESVPQKDDVWVDVSLLKPGTDGSKIYNVASTYAHNTGKMFIGDPAGLSDEALRRRTEQMISSALKFGTTEHLAPHPRQVSGDSALGVPPLRWVYGDDNGNFERMVDVSIKSMENAFPNSKLVGYDPKNGTFYRTDTGQVFTRQDMAGYGLDIAGKRSIPGSQAEKGQAGWRSVARVALLRELRAADSGIPEQDRRGLLERASSDVSRLRVDPVTGNAYSPESRIFYNRSRLDAIDTPDLLTTYTPDEALQKQQAEETARKAEAEKPQAPKGRKVTVDQVDLFYPQQDSLFARGDNQDGANMVMYHGSPRDSIGEFAADGNGLIFASPDPDVAEKYAYLIKRSKDFAGHKPTVYKVRVTAKNTLDFDNLPPFSGEAWQELLGDAIRYPEDGGAFNESDRKATWADIEEFGGRKLFDAIKAAGYDSIAVTTPGNNGREREFAVFSKDQIRQLNEPTAPESGGAFARGTPQTGMFAPNIWSMPEPTKLDRAIYEIQDGRVDLKRAQQAIESSGKKIAEKWDARLAETLYPGRVAYRSQQFLTSEVQPLLKALSVYKVPMEELADYLHARGAKERNVQVAKVNPDMPDGGAGRNTKGELMTNDAAQAYLDSISPTRKQLLDVLAAKVDRITAGTRNLLVSEGLEKQETIDAWTGVYKNYVPMFRDEAEAGIPHPQGTGFNVRGSASKRAMGSTKEVTNIIAHVLMQREAAITRSEKNLVALSLYGMALSHPNPDFWSVIKPSMSNSQIAEELSRMGVDHESAAAGMALTPSVTTVDPNTNKVVSRPNPLYKNLPGAITLRLNGEDRVLMLNTENERGMRLAGSLKNLDGLTKIDIAGSIVGKSTRWIAAVNTQYNPAFGLVNLVRDTLGGAVNLGNTELRGNALQVLLTTLNPFLGKDNSIIAIGMELRKPGSGGKLGKLYQQFQADGGQTGFKEQFRDPNERAKAIEKELATMDRSKWNPAYVANLMLDLLAGFNTTLENAVRLSAYEQSLKKGMSGAKAAQLARELTVDFNRKGRVGREAGPLYAFFNASVQGTERTIQTLKGPTGAKVIAGGIGLGVIQALMLAAAGYDDDDIPEFVKTRSLIIPLFDEEKNFISVPYPLGLHVLPNTGRVMTELVLNGGKDIGKRSAAAVGEIASAFNPLGGGNIFTADGALKTVAPTLIDPLIELGFNKDFTGRPIERQAFGGQTDARPGFAKAKEATIRSTTGQAYIGISKAINTMTGGNDYEAGAASPTPERIRYLAQVAGGGVLREIEKTINASTAEQFGKKVAASQIPVAGRFLGEVDMDRVKTNRYYENARKINAVETTASAIRKAGDTEAYRNLIKDHPEAALIDFANGVQSSLSKLNKQSVMMIDNPESLRAIDEARVQVMDALNQSIEALEKETRGETLGDKVKAGGDKVRTMIKEAVTP